MMIEAESAPVTKKIATSTTARPMSTSPTQPGTGRAPSVWNRMRSKLMSAPASPMAASAVPASCACSARSCRPMAPPPKIANHSVETMEGTSSTPTTNWRTVRPREMRAMKGPTNGVQDTHQAQ
jgi:hypothetical protein